MKKALLFILLIKSINLMAAPYNGQIMNFRQPDGTSVDVKLFGTEYYMRAEGLDEYTLIRDKSTGWICYAALSDDGTVLISTGIIYKGRKDDISTFRTDLSFSKHLDISAKARNSIILQNRHKLEGDRPSNTNKTDPYPVSGYIRGLCIVVDFSDEVGTLPKSEFDHFCNNLNYSNFGNNGSLRTYYFDISGGIVDYENIVYGYYRAPHTFAYYENLSMGVGAQQILGLALNWIESLGFDFSTLSISADNSITAINLMYTGVAQTWGEGMWWHQSYYGGFSADGVQSGNYNCSPAYSPLTIATVCHENGHMIGNWPDTYKYNYDTGPDGIGRFDLMCDYGDEFNPVPPNPHFWSNAGWGEVINETYYNGINSDTANSLTCYKYINPNDTNEFFLIENRSQTGRSASLPDEGLTIWHIDRNGDNQTTHHEVYLVHANNNVEDHSNACFHAGFNDEYGSTTTPGSQFFNGDPSGLRVWDISAVSNVMTYKLGAGEPAPNLVLIYQGISDDDNENGFLEPGESGNINITANNFGQIGSGNATITCTAIGANAGFVSLNNPAEIVVGTLDVSETVAAAYNVGIADETTIGTEIELKFLISDGTDSACITKKLLIGEQVIMGNQEITTCSALFFDDGGSSSNYSDMEDFTTTFLAPSAGQRIKVEFLTFGLEEETSCGYDYLSIYNGTSTFSPLIGKYCGTELPDAVTSTHASGALTFDFHSDEAVTDIGWSAIISCSDVNDLNSVSSTVQFDILPNPLTDIAKIEFNQEKRDNIQIKIVDICGTPVMTFTELNQSEIELKRDHFISGIYFVQLWDGVHLLSIKKLVVL